MTVARHAPGLLLFLATRNLLENRLTTALLVLAVAAGVGFQVPNTANLLGYDREVLAQGLDAGFGDVRVRARTGKRIEDADAMAARIAALPGVRAAVPLLAVPGAVGKDGRFIGVMVSGTDASAAGRPFRLTAGKLPAAGDREGILIGTALVARLGLRLGDPVELRLIYGPAGAAIVDDNVGRFTMSLRGLASGMFGACGADAAFVDRAFLGAEVGRSGVADLILVYSDDHFDARALAGRITATIPDLEARPWMDDSAILFSAVRASRAVATVSLAMVILAVVFPVWALLYIHVLQRQRQVGLLRALGIGEGEVFVAFLLQALLVGLAGVTLGLGIAAVLVRYFEAFPIFRSDDFVLRPMVTSWAFLWPAAVVLAATLLAGVYPAWRAARVDPARALRGIE
jgi:lipoprotein-releasing system permease protein